MGITTFFKKFMLARKVEMENGRFVIGDVRLTSMATSTLISIQDEIIKNIGEKDGIRILYNAGKIGGKELAKSLRKITEFNDMRLVDLLVEASTQMMGWGVIIPIKCDFDKHTASFRVDDSPLLLYGHRSGCHLERGLIAGAMEEIFKHSVDAVEVRCKSEGNAFCQFDVKPTEQFDFNDNTVKAQLQPPSGKSNKKQGKS